MVERNLLRCRNCDALPHFDHADKIRRLKQAVHSTGVKPRKAAAEALDVEDSFLQVHLVQSRDLKFSAGGWLDLVRLCADTLRIEIESGDRIIGLRLRRLLLNAYSLAAGVKFHHAEALRIRDIVAEDRRPLILFRVRDSFLQNVSEMVSIENVVTKDHCAGIVADKLFAEQECLGEAVGARLHLVLQVNSELASVTQQRLEPRCVVRRADDQDFVYARQHQRTQRIIDHRLVIDWQQLLTGDHGQRIKSCAGSTGKNNTFHGLSSSFVLLSILGV